MFVCCWFALSILLGLQLSQGAAVPRPVNAHQFKRIVGGNKAEPNKWPWQGRLLQLRTDGTNTYRVRCGVVLINTEWVVTTAVCVFNAERSTLRVVLGDHVRSQHEGTEQEFQVSVIHIHPRIFTDKGYGYNIAVLKLSSPVTITNAVKAIKLPDAGENVVVGEKCFMTGWGSTEFGGEKSDTLQQAKVPVVSYEDCRFNEQLNYSKIDDFSMFCVGHGDSKTLISGCNGDAGGAFSCEKDGAWILQGISSWGDAHCGGVYYSVMTRMSSFVHWINDQMKASPLEKPTSCIDNHFYCQEWKNKGWCNVGFFEMMLKGYYCKKTCEACY